MWIQFYKFFVWQGKSEVTLGTLKVFVFFCVENVERLSNFISRSLALYSTAVIFVHLISPRIFSLIVEILHTLTSRIFKQKIYVYSKYY